MVDQNGIGLFMLASECSRIALTLQPEMRDRRIRESWTAASRARKAPVGRKQQKDMSESRREWKQTKLDRDGHKTCMSLSDWSISQIATIRRCHLCHGTESDLDSRRGRGQICLGQEREFERTRMELPTTRKSSPGFD
jgi:hypothetical protein